MNKRLGKRDIYVLAILAAVLIIIFMGYKLLAKDGAAAVVTIDGKEYGRYALDTDDEIDIEINGHITNKLIIKDGCADMIWADCPDKLCVNMKEISHNNESIVCLPNKVVVVIENGEDGLLDDVAK